jgi:hypothetical protein
MEAHPGLVQVYNGAMHAEPRALHTHL